MTKAEANKQYLQEQVRKGKEWVRVKNLPYPRTLRELKSYYIARENGKLILPSQTL